MRLLLVVYGRVWGRDAIMRLGRRMREGRILLEQIGCRALLLHVPLELFVCQDVSAAEVLHDKCRLAACIVV